MSDRQTTPRSLLSAEKVRVGMTVMITDFTGMAFEREVVPENVESIKRATRAQNWSVTLLSDAPTEGRDNIVIHASNTGHTVKINAGRCDDCPWTEDDAPSEDRECRRCDHSYCMTPALCETEERAERAEAKLAEAERQRDLAIAHDRQPYPTTAAYEAVCAANEDKRQKLAEVRAKHYDVRATALSNVEAYAAMRRICNSCRQAWPCETRRIVDEGVTA